MSFSQAEIRILDQLTIPYKCLPPRKAARLKKAFQRSSFAYPPPISGAALAPTALNANKGRAGFDAYTDAVCHAGAARRLVMQQERGADYEDLAELIGEASRDVANVIASLAGELLGLGDAISPSLAGTGRSGQTKALKSILGAGLMNSDSIAEQQRLMDRLQQLRDEILEEEQEEDVQTCKTAPVGVGVAFVRTKTSSSGGGGKFDCKSSKIEFGPTTPKQSRQKEKPEPNDSPSSRLRSAKGAGRVS